MLLVRKSCVVEVCQLYQGHEITSQSVDLELRVVIENTA